MTRLPFILADLEAAIDGHLPKPRERMIELVLEPEAFAAVKHALADHFGVPASADDRRVLNIGQVAITKRV